MSFKEYALFSPFIRFFWSLLPSRCVHPECDDLFLRWTEHKLQALSKDKEVLGEDWICDDCVHKIRAQSFKNGWGTEQTEEGNLLFRNPLQSEGPEPLEE